MTTQLQYLTAKSAELEALAQDLFELDEESAETFGAMAATIASHIAEMEPYRPDLGIDEYRFTLLNIISTNAKIQAVDFLYEQAALRLNRKSGAVDPCQGELFDRCVACWKSFGAVDQYLFTENDPESPTTTQSPLGSLDPGAYV